MKKPTILVFSAGYIPGYRGGGPIRSIESIVLKLGNVFDFKIVTYDHDLGINTPYEDVTPDTWSKVGNADVYYASEKSLRLLALAKLIKSIDSDVMYLNSFFCTDFTIKPLLLRYLQLIPNTATIIAPRGEFSPGALKLKNLKKRFFFLVLRIFPLYDGLMWQASSELEKKEIVDCFGVKKISIVSNITIAPDLSCCRSDKNIDSVNFKKSGAIKIIFISRISPKKNLDGALSMLKGLRGDITFNIFGTMEDRDYWQKCQNICNSLDANIKVNYQGEIEHYRVSKVFAQHHLFLFPTHGENFGHVILEALLAGCPVLLSDQTPWKDLDSLGIGWDLPLDRPDTFRTALEHCVEMDNDEFTKMSLCSRSYGVSKTLDNEALDQNRELFLTAISSSL